MNDDNDNYPFQLIKIETYWNVNLFTNAFQGVATD